MPYPSVSPMTGELLALLDALRPGEWLALASADAPFPEDSPSLTVDTPLEHLAAAVFDILPISRDTPQPLASWAADSDEERFRDLGRAVEGLAADGSGRRLRAAPLSDGALSHRVTDTVAATVRVRGEGAPFVFLVCVGGSAQRTNARQTIACTGMATGARPYSASSRPAVAAISAGRSPDRLRTWSASGLPRIRPSANPCQDATSVS